MDVAYALRLEDVRRQAELAVLAAVVAAGAGAEVEVPQVDELIDRWHAALIEAPVRVAPADRERLALMQALELR